MSKSMRNALLVAVAGSAIVYVMRPLLKPLKNKVADTVKGA